jgi:hypothetical protein
VSTPSPTFPALRPTYAGDLLLPAYRAEVVATLLLAGELPLEGDSHQLPRLEQLVFKPMGIHARAYAPDATLAWFGDLPYYQFSAPREGLYDQLPPLLFHDPPPEQSDSLSPEAIKTSFRRAQAEQAEARRFFQPFDTELFYLRLLPYQQQLSGSDNFLHEFERAWPIIQSLSRPLASLFVQLLPSISEISADLKLVSELLSTFADVPVSLLARPPLVQQVPLAALRGVGEGQLGIDIIIGNSFLDEVNALEMAVGPVPEPRTAEFLPNGTASQLLTALLAYFIPASAEVVWCIHVNSPGSSSDGPAYLGYNSYLA